MGRGPNRKKVLIEEHVDGNRSVFAKVWLDTHKVDVSVPDRKEPGFHLRHMKDLTIEDARALLVALDALDKEGALNGRA